jgi:hypothetical protein
VSPLDRDEPADAAEPEGSVDPDEPDESDESADPDGSQLSADPDGSVAPDPVVPDDELADPDVVPVALLLDRLSAGSLPDASCTKIVDHAATNPATANATTVRRMRRVRLRRSTRAGCGAGGAGFMAPTVAAPATSGLSDL